MPQVCVLRYPDDLHNTDNECLNELINWQNFNSVPLFPRSLFNSLYFPSLCTGGLSLGLLIGIDYSRHSRAVSPRGSGPCDRSIIHGSTWDCREQWHLIWENQTGPVSAVPPGNLQGISGNPGGVEGLGVCVCVYACVFLCIPEAYIPKFVLVFKTFWSWIPVSHILLIAQKPSCGISCLTYFSVCW